MSQPFFAPGAPAAPPVTPVPPPATSFGTIAGAGTNVGQIATGARQVSDYDVSNQGTVWAYLKLYDGTAAPVAGAGTPVRTLGIAPSTSRAVSLEFGIPFTRGIGMALTTGAAINDAGTIATANQVVVNVGHRPN